MSETSPFATSPVWDCIQLSEKVEKKYVIDVGSFVKKLSSIPQDDSFFLHGPENDVKELKICINSTKQTPQNLRKRMTSSCIEEEKEYQKRTKFNSVADEETRLLIDLVQLLLDHRNKIPPEDRNLSVKQASSSEEVAESTGLDFQYSSSLHSSYECVSSEEAQNKLILFAKKMGFEVVGAVQLTPLSSSVPIITCR